MFLKKRKGLYVCKNIVVIKMKTNSRIKDYIENYSDNQFI